MKKHTKILFGTMIAVLVMAAPLAAQARPGGHGGPHMGYAENGGPGMHKGWYQALTPEKQQAVSALFKEHRDKMEPIREQLWLKNTTLDALSSNPKVEPKELTALIDEIAKLRKQASAERKLLAERMEKETGLKFPYGKGDFFSSGYGGGSGWHHKGGGRHRGGFGRGHGW